jgi:DNA topoisomerase-3
LTKEWSSIGLIILTRLLDGAFRWPRKGKSNDKAHPPIHPTKYTNGLAGDDKRVYEFIVRRFLGCCSDDAQGNQTAVVINIADETFHSGGVQVTERNYLDVYIYDGWTTRVIPDFQRGQQFMPTSCDMGQGKTSPPSLLREADLIGIMDQNGIGKFFTIV